jgi:hypothetical protein
VLQSNVGDACTAILAPNEPGRRRPTRTLAWPLRVLLSERPAASLGCGSDAEDNELAIILGLLPCGVGLTMFCHCERRRRESGLLGQQVAVALVVRPSVGACLRPVIRPVDILTCV